jgi:hypothetical protein
MPDPEQPVADDALGVRAPVVRLRRQVEGWQWRETGSADSATYGACVWQEGD